MTTLAHESGLQLAKRLNTGDLSALELLDYFLGRVGRFNPELNAIIELQEEEARARAIAADKALARERGRPLGPFHGVPMTIKESFDVAGMHTTRGNPAFKDHIATTDALAVSRLPTQASSGSEAIRANLTPHMKFEGKHAQRLKLS